MICVGQRYRTKKRLDVMFWWLIDTIAILDDYSDGAEGELGAGECLTVAAILEEEPQRVRCELDNPKPVIRRVLPPFYRSWGFRLGGRVVGFQVEIPADVVATDCDRLP
jgi:hypothetical protein